MKLTRLLCPVQVLGHDKTLAYEPWPEHDEALLVEDIVQLPIQVQSLTA